MSTPLDLSAFDNALKDTYTDGLVKQYTVNALLGQKLKTREPKALLGRKLIVGLKTGLAGVTGSRGERGEFPEGNSPQYENAEYTIGSHWGTINLTGKVMRQSRSDVGAFTRASRDQVETMQDEILLELNRQGYGDGSGKIAEVASEALSGGNTVLTLTSAEPIVAGHLFEGRRISVGTVADPSLGEDDARILEADDSVPSITISGDQTANTAAGQFVFNYGNVEAAGVSHEMTGLAKIVSVTAGLTVGGIDSSSVKIWDNLRDVSGGAITEAKIRTMYSRGLQKQAKLSEAMTSLGIFNDLGASLMTNKRFVNTQEIEGGFTSVKVDNVNVTGDPSHPWGKLHMLDTRYHSFYANDPWAWLEGYTSGAPSSGLGQILVRVGRKDEYEAQFGRDQALGTTRRNSSGVITATDVDGV
jgi:hypothetical protein